MKYNQCSDRATRGGFTLIELLVVIAIIGILAAILVPAINLSRQSALSAKSVSNLRQIGVAIMTRMSDNEGRFPITFGPQVVDGPNLLWSHEVAPYISGVEQPPSGTEAFGLVQSLWPIFISPTTIAPGVVDSSAPYLDSTYSMNGNLNQIVDVSGTILSRGLPAIRVANPAETVLLVDGGQWAEGSQADANTGRVFAETQGSTTPEQPIAVIEPGANRLFGWGTVAYRDQGRAATLWCDGHVSHMEKGAFRHKHFVINF
ncbi:MAG: prepilin-type N-terminal cleavage/methylation domain-containing protein [Lentimonas sp.]